MQLRNASTPVLVLPMDHYGSLGVMRSLGRLGVPVYGAHPTRRPISSFSAYCRKTFELDLDTLPQKVSVERLLDIARELGGKPLLMPTNDETAIFVADNASKLQHGSLFAHSPARLVWSLYNTKDMYFLAKHLSIPTAATVFPESSNDVLEFCEKAQFPVMLTPSDNIRASRRTGKKMVIV